MTRWAVFVIIVSIVCTHHVTEAMECAIPHEQKTRFFDTIEHYQGNKIPFSPLRGNWEGSNVEFTFNSIDKLSKNNFISEDSHSIISLKLSGKQIKEVHEGAFISLTCLRQLHLDHNNITTKLTRNVFQNLEKLEVLDLSSNRIEILKDLTFSDLLNLQTLNLSNNRIKTVEVLAFTNLTRLEYLNLGRNFIRTVFDELFEPVPNLGTLILSWNKLWDASPEKWHGLGKLQHLELAGNSLNRFDPSYNFSFFAVKSLNLSFNSLSMLNTVAIRRHLPQLEVLDLNNNPWFCNDLEAIIRDLNDSKVKFPSMNFSTVSVHGIACSEVSRFSSVGTTEGVTATTVKNNVTWVSKDELERYVERKIKHSNEGLNNSIQSLRAFAIFAFALLCVFIVFEILYRTNICGVIISKLKGGNELYVDDNNIENFRLLHR
ncbi:SLIT and NTRK-like protein 1 isoform X4 [Zophobas morio]